MQTLTKTTNFMPHVYHGFSFTTHATYKQTTQTPFIPLISSSHYFIIPIQSTPTSTSSTNQILSNILSNKHSFCSAQMSRKLGTTSSTCSTCGSTTHAAYNNANSAFLCPSCDVIDFMMPQLRHMRVCDVCAHAPAVFVRRADTAMSLCSSCDAKIHYANPLAGRHQRVPIPPIGEQNREFDDDDVAEVASWFVLNPEKNDGHGDELLFGGKVGDYLELVEDCNSCAENENGFCDVHFDDCSVHHRSYEMEHKQLQRFQTGLVFDSSKPAYGSTISQNVSNSSTEFNSVPELTMSELSISHSKPATGTLDLSSEPLMPSYLTYREARVLRYREKKKTRKFEKKIRYASRKAYAEVRPRIKGRFAKRNNIDPEMDHMFSSTLITESGCSIVPSF